MGENTAGDAGKPQIIVDEDWKAKVEREKDEAAHADESPAQGEAGGSPKSKQDWKNLPPADFNTLLTMFSTQAMVALGVIPHPTQPQTEPELVLARHFIDLLTVLEEKTKGNLTPEEASGLESSLHYLRMAFLQVSQGKS